MSGQTTTTATVTASGKTGGACQIPGPYQPQRHTAIVVMFKRGDTFPVDPVDGQASYWNFARPTTAAAS